MAFLLKKIITFLFALSFMAGTVQAEALKPYVLAGQSSSDLATQTSVSKALLEKANFQVVGEYAPYEGAQILIITNDALRKLAAQSEFGGYGAALRVALTQAGDKVQISYTNPSYMAAAYRMKGNLSALTSELAGVLGAEQAFGSENGLSDEELRDYHYMIMMPYFTDQVELAEHADYDAALKAVEAGLAAGKGGTKKIYRVDVGGKEETLFGVAISEGEGADATVMKATDLGNLKHTAHLPYEMLVSGNKVYSLHGKFRIAQSFPDLSMGSFMEISGAPDAIAEALKAAAN